MLPIKVLIYQLLICQDEDLRVTGRATVAAIPSRCLHVLTICTCLARFLIQCYQTGPDIVNRGGWL